MFLLLSFDVNYIHLGKYLPASGAIKIAKWSVEILMIYWFLNNIANKRDDIHLDIKFPSKTQQNLNKFIKCVQGITNKCRYWWLKLYIFWNLSWWFEEKTWRLDLILWSFKPTRSEKRILHNRLEQFHSMHITLSNAIDFPSFFQTYYLHCMKCHQYFCNDIKTWTNLSKLNHSLICLCLCWPQELPQIGH